MKNFFIFSLFIIIFTACSQSENKIESLLYGKDISFLLINKNQKVICAVACNQGEITCNYGTDYIHLQSIENRIEGKKLYVDYVYSVFNVLGIPAFRDFDFPKFYEITITEKQIRKRIESIKYKEIPDTSKRINGTCNALIVCDSLRIRESPNTDSTTKVVGKLKKWDKVTAIDCTETKTRIDNLEYPWYKIRLEDGTEGWVFGGFAKIYFSEEDLQLLYKAFEKEGSEYINQFVTPDNF